MQKICCCWCVRACSQLANSVALVLAYVSMDGYAYRLAGWLSISNEWSRSFKSPPKAWMGKGLIHSICTSYVTLLSIINWLWLLLILVITFPTGSVWIPSIEHTQEARKLVYIALLTWRDLGACRVHTYVPWMTMPEGFATRMMRRTVWTFIIVAEAETLGQQESGMLYILLFKSGAKLVVVVALSAREEETDSW